MKATIILALAAAFTGQAFAQTAPAEDPAANTSVQTAAPSISDKLGVSAQVIGFGPAIGSPREGDHKLSRNPDPMTGIQDGQDSINTENYLKAKYKISDEMSIAPVFFTKYYAGAGDAKGKKLTIEDSYVSVAHSKLYHNGAFNLSGDLRTYLPMSDASQAISQVVMFRQNIIAAYDVGRFTLSAYGYGRYRVYSKDLAGQEMLRAYLGPEVDYQLSPTLKLTALYEMSAQNMRGRGITDWDNHGTDFEPGLSWDVTPRVNVSPFLDIKTGARAALDTTSANVSVTVTML